MNAKRVGIMIYGDANSSRNALTEEKYKDLASAFQTGRFQIESILYHDEAAALLSQELLRFDAVLVWVNPIEQGRDRKRLDDLLTRISSKGVFVSAHPEVILKIGTKDVLFRTKGMEWASDVDLYQSLVEFVARFPCSLAKTGVRVLKRYRGNGGDGVYKVSQNAGRGDITVVHAKGNEVISYAEGEFYNAFSSFFLDGGMLIDQEWNSSLTNGMVRCYVSGLRVSGFGYQEVNALYESQQGDKKAYAAPSKRYYYSESCGLFRDLKEIMEDSWIPQLQESQGITDSQLPVIWDADFFINKLNTPNTREKYALCEINVSSVSPFPPSAIPYIVNEVRDRVR